MIIDQQILDELTAQAKDSPRLGMDLDLRYSSTDHKSSIEDVSDLRGQGIRRVLMEHIIGYVRNNLAALELNLTSSPKWVAANELYQKMGLRGGGQMCIGYE